MLVRLTGLPKERLRQIIIIAVVLVALIIYLSLYRPLGLRLKSARLECNTIERELFLAKEAIAALRASPFSKTLLNETDIFLLIDEITKKAKSGGINFINLVTKNIERPPGSGYRIVPIEIDLESSYEQLGKFLGLSDELKNGIVRIESFQVTKSQNSTWRLKTKLLLNAYLSGSLPQETKAEEKYISLKRSCRRTTYTRWVRNPFSQSTTFAEGGLILTGISWDAKVPKAIIGNTIVGIGDKIDTNTVIDIQKDRVIVNDGSKDIELRL